MQNVPDTLRDSWVGNLVRLEMISSLGGMRLAVTLHELIEVGVKVLFPLRLCQLLLAFVSFKLDIDCVVLL